MKMTKAQKENEVFNIIQNVKLGYRTKNDLKRCNCKLCQFALQIINSEV